MNIHSMPQHHIGLIFGKFYPLHCGHIYLIEKAASQVDELHIILGCEQARDLALFEQSGMVIQPKVKDRLCWLQKTFKNRHNIHIHVLDEAGIASYPNGWQDWSDRVKTILSEHQIKPTIIFTSDQQDISKHQQYFGCEAKVIDANREFINISATKIRQQPYQNRAFIAQVAKPFFVKKVAVIGHKLDKLDKLPNQLANVYNTEYVSNGYTNYIHHQHVQCSQLSLTESDYIKIALLHAKRIDEATHVANGILFTSCDFQTFHHFYQKIFKRRSAVLAELEQLYSFDLVIDKNLFNENDSTLTMFERGIQLVEQLLN